MLADKAEKLIKKEKRIKYSKDGALVHSIETMGLVDGPGLRTIFFLQGCPLRCAYCHNPDSQQIGVGKFMSCQEILRTIKRYRSYYGAEGGVTFSGGEPLLQGAFLANFLPMLKKEGINTCIDSSAFGDPTYYPDIFPYIDTLLLDIKAFDDQMFYDLVKGHRKTLLKFMDSLYRYNFHGQIWIRHVMVPGFTDSKEYMDKMVEMLLPISSYIERIEILPYHTMGVDKYKEIGREYTLKGIPAMDKDKAKKLQKYINRKFVERASIWRNEEKKKEDLMTTEWVARSYMPRDEYIEKIDQIKNLPLVKEIDPSEIDEAVMGMRIMYAKKGEYIFRSGDPADSMYLMIEGTAKIFVNTIDGREQIFYIYNEGDFIGGHNLLAQVSYLYMGQALSDSSILVIPKKIFNKYMINKPLILQTILGKSFERIRWAEELIQRLTSSNASIKTAALILRLANEFGQENENGDICLELEMTREELGSYAGLTRETISRKLGEFKELGYLDFEGNKLLIIKNMQALVDSCM